MTNCNMDEKEKLILEVSKYLHPSGRKKRSDAGVPRNSYGPHKTKSSPVSSYKRILQQLLNKASETNDNNLITYDVNGYYCVIDEKFDKEFGEFKDIKNNKSRTVRYKRTQSKIDLEEYRFNAWKFNVINSPNSRIELPNHDLTRWCYERYGMTKSESEKLLQERQFTWIELFTLFYHISDAEVYRWTYKVWRVHYDRCPKEFLSDDFKFNLSTLPGTPEFHPEWAYKVEELEEQKAKEAEDKKAMHSYAAKLGAKYRKTTK